MITLSRLMLVVPVLALISSSAHAGITLGTAADFAVLAGSTVTNTGSTIIDGGNVGVSAGTSITGFSPGTLEAPYTFQVANQATTQAQIDLLSTYNAVAALTPTVDLTGQDLGSLTLTPGVYHFATSAELTGTLTLNDLGDPNAQFIFQVGSSLTTAVGSSVVMINSGSTPGSNIFWQVGSSATLGTGTAFLGSIMAQSSIWLSTGATILDGSALALTGAVTLDDNLITNASVPEPAAISMMVIGLSMIGFPRFRRIVGERRATI